MTPTAPATAPLEFRTDHLGGALHTYYFAADTPADEPRVLYVQHGHAEHAGRYAHVSAFFAASGFDVVLWDHQGHGKSTGKRGAISSWRGFTGELNSVRAEMERRLGGRHDTYLYGHSLGGLSTLYYLMHNPGAVSVTAAVVTSPPLHLSKPPSAALRKSANFLAAVAPDVTISNDIDPADLSRDPGVVSLFTVDPLIHDRVSFRLGASMLKVATRLLTGGTELPCPLLLMHGDADGVCHVDGSRKFAARATAGAPVTFRVWPGAYHELHNEPEREEVLAVARDFYLANPTHRPQR